MPIARWLLALVLLAGCTSTPMADPTPSVSGTPTTAAACPVADVTVGQATNPTQQFTSVARRTTSGATEELVQVVEDPFTPSLSWETAPVPADAEVLAAIDAQESAPADVSTGAVDLSAEVASHLSGADSPGASHVGYASIVVADHAVTVSCAGGGSATGTLTTWSDSEVGAVSCTASPPATSQEPSAIAQREYCPAD